MSRNRGLKTWLSQMLATWRREFYLVFSDIGVMLFFFGLPTLYPIVYTLIYNPEVVKDQPIAVVDQCRTSKSRELTRMIDATDAIKVDYYAPSLSDARRLMNEHKIYGIFVIPEDYDKQLGRREVPTVTFYSDMSLLLRYRTFVLSLTNVQLALGEKLRGEYMDDLGLVASSAPGINIKQEGIMMGDPTQGFASFVIPGILVLILQQSMILGVSMLAAGASESRRRNGGIDPFTVPAAPGAALLGKVMCYVLLYVPLVIYILHFVPEIFALPHVGNVWHYLMFILPLLTSSAMLGIAVSAFVTERETSLLVVVFTSVIFLFLSGLTWPRYAMNSFWQLVGDFIPAIWGVEGFVRLNGNGASLVDEGHCYMMMWLLTLLYAVPAYILLRYRDRSARLRAGQLL